MIIRGSDLERIAAEIETIQNANEALAQYHRERRCTLTAGPSVFLTARL